MNALNCCLARDMATSSMKAFVMRSFVTLREYEPLSCIFNQVNQPTLCKSSYILRQ